MTISEHEIVVNQTAVLFTAPVLSDFISKNH